MTGQFAPPGGGKPSYMLNADKETAALDPQIQDVLGRALRALSKDIVSAPIPDKFLALLAALEAKEKDK